MYKDLKDMEGAGIVDGMSRFIPSSDKFFFPHSFLLKLNLSFLIIHGSIMLVLWPFRLETVPIGGGKVLILLSLSLIFIKLEIVAGILFDEQSGFSSKESALTSLVLLLTNLSSLATSVNLPFLLLFDLIIVFLILQLKRLISSAPRSTIFSISILTLSLSVGSSHMSNLFRKKEAT